MTPIPSPTGKRPYFPEDFILGVMALLAVCVIGYFVLTIAAWSSQSRETQAQADRVTVTILRQQGSGAVTCMFGPNVGRDCAEVTHGWFNPAFTNDCPPAPKDCVANTWQTYVIFGGQLHNLRDLMGRNL